MRITAKNMLTISFAGAVLGTGCLAAIALSSDNGTAVMLTALCGWLIGVFHGIFAEIKRSEETHKTND